MIGVDYLSKPTTEMSEKFNKNREKLLKPFKKIVNQIGKVLN